MKRLGPAIRSLAAIGLGLLAAGCAVKPAGAPQPRPAEPVLPAPPAPAAAPALTVFEAQQRTLAQAATREGRLQDAAFAWDAVLALHPQDEEALAGRQAVLAQAQAQAAERLTQARAARNRGQLDTASRLYLEVLVLLPTHVEAANALRTIERDRARRQAVGNFARAPQPGEARNARPARNDARQQDLEHASLLARQGELDAAIALLSPAAGARRSDAAGRQLLAELLAQRAERSAASSPAAAIADLQQSLRHRPGHAQTRARLQALQAQQGPAPAARPAPVNRASSPPGSAR